MTFFEITEPKVLDKLTIDISLSFLIDSQRHKNLVKSALFIDSL